MTDRVPAPREPLTLPTPLAPEPSPAESEKGLRVRDVWGILRRNTWLILVPTVCATAIAVFQSTRITPTYEARTTIRLQQKDPTLPDIFRTLGTGSNIATEIEALRSRKLVEDAVGPLGLQLVLTSPSGVPRSRIVRDVTVRRGATPDAYFVQRRPQRGFRVWRQSDSLRVDYAVAGQPVKVDSVSFTLTAEAADYPNVVLQLDDLEPTVARVAGGIQVAQAARDAQIIVVSYSDADPDLVWRVPNALARGFIETRQQTQKTEARSTVAFLREQIDTIAAQLSRSEDALRKFREREQVVNPAVEASTQVSRYIALQAERSTVQSERDALAQLLDEVQVAASRARPGDPSPYRRLLAFPSLLRSRAASDLLGNLSKLEDDRAALLSRRTEIDPDAQALTARIREIEEQLRISVSTYLQGLNNQSASIEKTLEQYSQQLARVPHRELEYARLQRQPEVLGQMYSLLQTKLTESEVAQAVEDGSVRIVDEAVPPLEPVDPQRNRIVAAGLLIGLLLGIGLAFLRELMDRSVHTRSDVYVTTGLPVLGLIPRIPRPRRGFAMIAQPSKHAHLKIRGPEAATAPSPPADPGTLDSSPGRRRYTFLSPAPANGEAPAAPTVGGRPSSLPLPVARIPHVTIHGIGTAVTEAYGSLQTNLLYSSAERQPRTLVFTSALPQEGKSTNSVNLALTLAQRGVRVILVDADLRRSVIHRLFHVSRTPGLSDVLNGTVSIPEALHLMQVEEGGVLHFLTAGKTPLNPVATLESAAMNTLLGQLREEFDVVILDAPPVNILTDAAVLAAKADGVILVVRAGVTETMALEYAVQQLQLVDARVLGVVLNDIDFKRDAAYDSVYRFYDYKSYTSHPTEI